MSQTPPDAGEIASPLGWPMPSPAGAGLPNPASYDTATAGVVLDDVTGLAWQRDFDAASLDWADAVAACDALTLGGLADWRLPSLVELVSLVDFARAQPAIDPEAFPDTPADSFWTSTPVAGPPGQAWYINFSTGFSYPGHRDFLFLRVRCVRGQARAPAGTAVLVWERDQADPLAWAAAEERCRARARAGAPWRLPTMKELQTIVDVARTDPAIDVALFPGTVSAPAWSSSPLAGSSGTQAWAVDFSLGASSTLDAATAFRSRCVR